MILSPLCFSQESSFSTVTFCNFIYILSVIGSVNEFRGHFDKFPLFLQRQKSVPEKNMMDWPSLGHMSSVVQLRPGKQGCTKQTWLSGAHVYRRRRVGLVPGNVSGSPGFLSVKLRACIEGAFGSSFSKYSLNTSRKPGTI